MTTLNRQLLFFRRLTYLFIAFTLLTACNGNSKNKDTKQTKIKYETYCNNQYDYTVEYPDFLIPQGESENLDGQMFCSEDKSIKLLVYCDYKIDFNSDGDYLPIREAYELELASEKDVFNKELADNHYIIEYKKGEILHTNYALLDDYRYFNVSIEYPEAEKEMMKDIIKYVIKSLKVEGANVNEDEYESNVPDGGLEEVFPAFLSGFLYDCYWGKNFNSLLRNKDKVLATYIDPKMDVRRYYAPGTISILGTRDGDFGFTQYDDFDSKPKTNGKEIFKFIASTKNPCELDSDNNNTIYYQWISKVPDVVVNTETFETRPVETIYSNAKIMAAYLPNLYGNPVGFYFINTPDGWKLAFIDDTLCGA